VSSFVSLLLLTKITSAFQKAITSITPANAIIEIKNNLKTGKQVVYDADLSKYFDTIYLMINCK